MSISPENRLRFWIVWLSICAAAVLVPSQTFGQVGQESKNAKWEYCDLTRIANQATSQAQYVLTKRKTQLVAASLKELGEKLKMDGSPAYTVTVLDFLGEEGWELVSSTAIQNAPQTFTETYLLKRKR